jgi:DNA-binding response OmpR family regulator
MLVTGQCSILYINTDGFKDTQASALRALGFDVVEAADVPARETLAKHHGVIVRLKDGRRMTSVAARLRAAPLFGRRVLIALVPASVTIRERREGVDCGFNAVLPRESSARDLAASILSMLRRLPEHKCLLRSHNNRRRAVA